MRIGIPKEVKVAEGRVALLPDAVMALTEQGCSVSIERGAGLASGASDEAYVAAGASVAADAQALFGQCQLLVKVKEPQAQELPLLRADHRLFCFLHLAAEPALTQALQEIGLTAIGFETLADDTGLPLLAPMSRIAGRVAVQMGAYHLQRGAGGKGLLLGGLDGRGAGRVLVLGAGNAGLAAAATAHALGAETAILDIRDEALQQARKLLPACRASLLDSVDLCALVAEADLLVGAVLVAGAKSPQLVGPGMVAAMESGSVIADIAVDQGGCVSTIRPTTLTKPAYMHEGVVHLGVTNLPGSVPYTASAALSQALMPWVGRLAASGPEGDQALQAAINVRDGEVVHPALRRGI